MLEALSVESPDLIPSFVPPKRRPFATYRLRPGRCMFLGGLVRIDYSAASAPDTGLLLTVCSHLPVHTSRIERADGLWARHVLGQWPEKEEEDGDEEDDEDGPSSAIGVTRASDSKPAAATTVGASDSVSDSDANASDNGSETTSKGGTAKPASSAAILRPNWGPLMNRASIRLAEHAPHHAQEAVTSAARWLAERRGGGYVHHGSLADTTAASAGGVHSSGSASSAAAASSPVPVVSFVGGAETDSDDELSARSNNNSGSSSGATAGFNPRRTLARRMARERRAVLDIVLPGLGWVAVSPIEIEGTPGWAPAIAGASLHVLSCRGVTAHVRSPLLPYEASGSRPKQWLE